MVVSIDYYGIIRFSQTLPDISVKQQKTSIDGARENLTHLKKLGCYLLINKNNWSSNQDSFTKSALIKKAQGFLNLNKIPFDEIVFNYEKTADFYIVNSNTSVSESNNVVYFENWNQAIADVCEISGLTHPKENSY